MWNDNSFIGVLAGRGAITANCRASSTDVSYFVINNTTMDVAAPIDPEGVHLGRALGEYARVCFQDTSMTSIIVPEGWLGLSSSLFTDHITYQEYGNTGAGAGAPELAIYLF